MTTAEPERAKPVESALPDVGIGSGAIDLPPECTSIRGEHGPELDVPPNARTMINLLNMRARRIE